MGRVDAFRFREVANGGVGAAFKEIEPTERPRCINGAVRVRGRDRIVETLMRHRITEPRTSSRVAYQGSAICRGQIGDSAYET